MQPNICQGKSNNQKRVYRLLFASEKSTNKVGQGDFLFWFMCGTM